MEAQMRFFVEAARLPPRQRTPRPPLIARAAHAATAAYQRATKAATTNRRQVQQENQRLKQENQRLRDEVRHCWDAIDALGRLLGLTSEHPNQRVEHAVIVSQRRLIEVHLRDQLAAELEEARREGYAEGYVDGLARRDDGDGSSATPRAPGAN
ncbi:hypothetical protein [Salinispora arenicola]|uniref:hypothetical protein n=1 Tax=Salinispora arenicola TaxID=168697 RepID=UPI00036BC8DC|nr:hypothetical protein [Salinispora arenicola]